MAIGSIVLLRVSIRNISMWRIRSLSVNSLVNLICKKSFIIWSLFSLSASWFMPLLAGWLVGQFSLQLLILSITSILFSYSNITGFGLIIYWDGRLTKFKTLSTFINHSTIDELFSCYYLHTFWGTSGFIFTRSLWA